MSGFQAGYLEIEPRELVRFLIHEAGQFKSEYLNTAELLSLLKLECIRFPFERELPTDSKATIVGAHTRALLSFADRLIAIDSELKEKRCRFSVLHEIAHFVLPNHENAFYICDDLGLSHKARLSFEQEANEFAADLLFLGDRILLEANSRRICASTVKELADKYQASYESTARRIIQKNFKPCMLLTFEQDETETHIDPDRQPSWSVKYCTASPPFKTRFFERIRGTLPSGNCGNCSSTRPRYCKQPYG